jgi:alpha-beta hydrolase superfamily lysophospholipase
VKEAKDGPFAEAAKQRCPVEFQSADGTTLRGWWIPSERPSTRTLVFVHGLATNRTITLPFHEVGDRLDANVLMFDLRAHGDSGGRTVTLGWREKDDVLAAIEFVRREKPQQARVGISMGAASMAQAASEIEPPLAGVILDSSYCATREMTESVLKPFPSAAHPWLRR